MHLRPFATDSGIGALSLDHEAQGGLGVAVWRGDLAGQDHLQPGIEAAGDAGLAGQGGVFQYQHAALGFPWQ
jgi:hypothetical protein